MFLRDKLLVEKEIRRHLDDVPTKPSVLTLGLDLMSPIPFLIVPPELRFASGARATMVVKRVFERTNEYSGGDPVYVMRSGPAEGPKSKQIFVYDSVDAMRCRPNRVLYFDFRAVVDKNNICA
jgi:hypothetical protein